MRGRCSDLHAAVVSLDVLQAGQSVQVYQQAGLRFLGAEQRYEVGAASDDLRAWSIQEGEGLLPRSWSVEVELVHVLNSRGIVAEPLPAGQAQPAGVVCAAERELGMDR